MMPVLPQGRHNGLAALEECCHIHPNQAGFFSLSEASGSEKGHNLDFVGPKIIPFLKQKFTLWVMVKEFRILRMIEVSSEISVWDRRIRR